MAQRARRICRLACRLAFPIPEAPEKLERSFTLTPSRAEQETRVEQATSTYSGCRLKAPLAVSRIRQLRCQGQRRSYSCARFDSGFSRLKILPRTRPA